jgi:hypothetical protein
MLNDMEDGRIDPLLVVANQRLAVTFVVARILVVVHPWVVGEPGRMPLHSYYSLSLSLSIFFWE